MIWLLSIPIVSGMAFPSIGFALSTHKYSLGGGGAARATTRALRCVLDTATLCRATAIEDDVEQWAILELWIAVTLFIDLLHARLMCTFFRTKL